MKKINYLILPVFFFGFIYFMFFNQIFQWKTYETKAEKRALAKRPSIHLNQLDKFPSEFDAYLNDNYTFRVPFMNSYHELKFRMRVSPNINDVIIGTGGHFFVAKKDQKVYRGKYAFTRAKMDALMNIWEIRNRYLSAEGISFYWLAAPNKHHVFPEHLPLGYKERTRNRTLVLQERFNSRFPSKFIYPLDALLHHEDKPDTYYKQDNHWTDKGAFIAFLELMKVMKKDDPSLKTVKNEDIQWKKEKNKDGNLLNFLGKEGELSEMIYVAEFPHSSAKEVEKFHFKPPEGFPYPWDYEFHFKNEKALNKKKVLVIRDSFGQFIMPFFNETFSETLFIFDAWKYGVNKEIIERFQPDIIVFLTFEIHTDNVLKHPPIIDKEQ